MPDLAVVIPTIAGREDHFKRCIESYKATTPKGTRFFIEYDHPSCGHAWIAGARRASEYGFDYLHLTNDDIEAHQGWLDPATEAVDDDKIPAPLVYHPNGDLESAGLLALGCYRGEHWDWMPIEGTTVPFMSVEMWDRIGMIPVHYCSDLWVSAKGRLEGYETVVRTGMRFTHHTAMPGRDYSRVGPDTQEYMRLIAAAS